MIFSKIFFSSLILATSLYFAGGVLYPLVSFVYDVSFLWILILFFVSFLGILGSCLKYHVVHFSFSILVTTFAFHSVFQYMMLNSPQNMKLSYQANYTKISYKELFSPLDLRIKEKPVMIKFTADWCLGCKSLEQNLFSLPKVANYLNCAFDLYEVDYTNKLILEQEVFKEKWNIFGLPVVLWMNQEQEILKRLEIEEREDFFIRDMLKLFPQTQGCILEE